MKSTRNKAVFTNYNHPKRCQHGLFVLNKFEEVCVRAAERLIKGESLRSSLQLQPQLFAEGLFKLLKGIL